MKKNNTKEATRKADRATERRNHARAILLTWDSLRSHLAATASNDNWHGGNAEWHARCCREYGEVIYTLTVGLHRLALLDFAATTVSDDRPI